ncbi:hypothetical protein BT63DRAFT_460566 [Microthyrium microscopicum]|uniref:Flavin reductase like domain-containing protein n=1 Tax=Microthyrium microscopicum TaxID=703497 RepID=A0A6A6TY46_9PEZI|nr:hypothetical protein BT63DRAFT_460566 [Microthyrium microscopicum]
MILPQSSRPRPLPNPFSRWRLPSGQLRTFAGTYPERPVNPSGVPRRLYSSASPKQDASQDDDTKTAQQPQALEVDPVRQFMRHIAHPIFLITASTSLKPRPHDSTDYTEFYGATVSSLTTVTFDPHPTIIFNLRKGSLTLDAILSRKRFRAVALRALVKGQRIAEAFALKQSHETAFQELANMGIGLELSPVAEDKSEKPLDYYSTSDDQTVYAPELSTDSIVGSLECQLMPDHYLEIGDHAVVVAQVLAAKTTIWHVLDENSGCPSLIYGDRNYGRLKSFKQRRHILIPPKES